jgi:mannose-6-phosphate isomerase-like protein (cupin superfamily)
MAYTVVAAGDVEPAFGVFRKMRLALGASAFGINQVDLPAGASGREHDEAGSGQEEVYVVLAGSGTMRVDAAEVALRPGMWLRVDAASTRLPTAGPDGLSFIAVGGRPGAGYVPRQAL